MIRDKRSSPPRHVDVLLVLVQLQRRVPGGIGTYGRGLIHGLEQIALEVGDSESGESLVVDLTLLLSRYPKIKDHLGKVGRWSVKEQLLPVPMLTRAWDFSMIHAPRGFNVVHSISMSIPPLSYFEAWDLRQNHRSPTNGTTKTTTKTTTKSVTKAKGLRSRSVVTVHDLAWRRYPDSTTARGFSWHEKALAHATQFADGIVVPSELVASELEDTGIHPDRIWIAPGGTDHLIASDEVATDRLLRRLGVQGDFILSVGTIEPRKNLSRLLEAHRIACKDLKEPLPLVVVGPTGWGSVDVSGQAVSNVYLAGEVSSGELSGLYERALVFAYVPLTEGYGLPPLEAMRMGTPVLASSGVPSVTLYNQCARRGSNSEISPSSTSEVKGDRNLGIALIVDPLDSEEIAHGLVQLATDSSLRERFVANGRAFVEQRTWKDVAYQHMNLWRSLT